MLYSGRWYDMQVLKTIKPGETFAMYITIEKEDGTPITDMADRLKMQVRTSIDELISDVSISETQTPGQYLLEVNDTKKWPEGVLYTDILIRNEGRVKISETLKIIVTKEVTKDE